ncbi:MAG: hypothetical protein ACTSUK_09275 [Promethearchaeota archaeon]
MIDSFVCQECGSNHVVEMDGFFVCQGCGLTFDEPVMQENMSALKTDKKGRSIQTHAILLSYTQIGNDSERRYKKVHVNYEYLNKINKYDRVDLSRDDAKKIFKRFIFGFDVSVNLELLMKFYDETFPKIKRYTKSRNLNLFCATAFYIVMHNEMKYVSIKKLLKESEITINEFFICLKSIMDIFPDLFKEKFEKRNLYIKQYISKAVDDLKLPGEVFDIAGKIADKFSDRLGLKNRIIASGAVAIAVRIMSLDKLTTINEISRCLEITASTVYCRIKGINIDILRRRYLEYLYSMENLNHTYIPKVSIHERIKTLKPETMMQESKPIKTIKTEIPIPIISIEPSAKKLKKRTSKFISDNRKIFARFISTPVIFGSFGRGTEERKILEIPKSLQASDGFAGFSEFEFSPPIS